MHRIKIGILAFVALTGLNSCGGGNDPVDEGGNYYDVLILFDSAGQDTGSAADEGGRDFTIAIDEGTPEDNGNPVDTNQPVDNGTGGDTNQPTDEGGADTATPEDTAVPEDTATPDDNGTPEDTAQPSDTSDPEDTGGADCSGACAYGTDKAWCFDGGSACVCGEGGLWESIGCTGACSAQGLSGDTCVPAAAGAYCDCQYDCTDTVAVQKSCTDLTYTPCTCAAADPCNWQDDDYCDKLCEMAFPDDYFVETVDCECSGSCSTLSFAGFCDNDGGACSCDLGSMTSTNCLDYCTDMAADLHQGEWCYTYQTAETEPPLASCACENFDCDDSWGVDVQCDNMLYTPCTCAIDNPCFWIGDDYCDSTTCNELYPGQQNFDDSSQDC